MSNRVIDGAYWAAIGVGSVACLEWAWRGRYNPAVVIFLLLGVVAGREAWASIRRGSAPADGNDEPDPNLELVGKSRLAAIALFCPILAIGALAEGRMWAAVLVAVVGFVAAREWSTRVFGKRR